MKQASIHTEPTKYHYDNNMWLYNLMYAFFYGFVHNDDYTYDLKPIKKVNILPITSYTYDTFIVLNTDYNYFCGNMTIRAQYTYDCDSTIEQAIIPSSETGLDYFGARYYASNLSIWLSVDPLASKYPSMSPYIYAAGNPVMLVDPDGRRLKIGLLTRIFNRSAYNAFNEVIQTESGKKALAPYMTKHQAKKFLGKGAKAGKYSRNNIIRFKTGSSEDDYGYTSGKVRNIGGESYDISDTYKDGTINFDKKVKSKLTIYLYDAKDHSHGENTQTVAHEVGVHLGGMLKALEDVICNNNLTSEQKRLEIENRFMGDASFYDPDLTLDGSSAHFLHSDGRSSKLYNSLSKDLKRTLKNKDLNDFIKAENDDTEY